MACPFVGHDSDPCKSDTESTEMPFGAWTRVSPRNRVLGGGTDLLMGRGTFGGDTWACPDLPAVNILNTVH